MKKILFVFIALHCYLIVNAQYITQVEILDNVTSHKKDFEGNDQRIDFSLIRKYNDSSKVTFKYVSIMVQKESISDVTKNTGFVITSNLNFAIGGSATVTTHINSSSVILHKEDLELINKFLNSTLNMAKTKPTHSIIWAYNYRNMVFGILYEKNDPDSYSIWKYYIKINNTQFDISYDEGKKLIAKFVDFSNEL